VTLLNIDFGFFFQPAGFDISHAPFAFVATDSFARAFAVGLEIKFKRYNKREGIGKRE